MVLSKNTLLLLASVICFIVALLAECTKVVHTDAHAWAFGGLLAYVLIGVNVPARKGPAQNG